MTSRNIIPGLTAILVGIWTALPAMAAAEPQTPLHAETTRRVVLAVGYPQGDTLAVELEGTSRLPRANGEAKVERKQGATEIELELDEMKPAHLFGGDYNTYVLWAISPEGRADNLGELILEGNRGKLNVTTPLETFGLLVSAEPHFLVSSPSDFVVLQNREIRRGGSPLSTSTIGYTGFSGEYEFDHASLETFPETRATIHPHLEEARTAVELAERSGAAPEELVRAREALARAEGHQAAGADPKELVPLAHEAVGLAVNAELVAEERASREAVAQVILEKENAIQEKEQRIRELASQAAAARTVAERSQLEAERERLRAEVESERAGRAEREARQAESALESTEEELRELEARAEAAATEAERARIIAEQQRLRAVLDAQRVAEAEDRARREMIARMEAEQEAEQARIEKEEARRELQLALAEILEVRETARGLIVNVPNLLFDLDEASLRPEGRRKLAQVAGVLALARGFHLSIEGHADRAGDTAYNLDLSRRRAESVQDHLVSLGVPRQAVSTKAWGEERPIAPNETAEGRQQNRRVEIVVEELPDFAIVVLRPTEEQ